MRNNKNKKIGSLLIVITIILVLINLILLIKYFVSNGEKKEEKNIQENNTINQIETKPEESQEIDKIKAMSEQDRIEYYVRTFVQNLELQNYDEDYKVLYGDFKNNYFPTLEEFKKYCTEKIGTEFVSFNIESIERLGNSVTGNMYVISGYLGNVLEHNEDYKKEISYFVIREKDYNNYELSFNVKK